MIVTGKNELSCFNWSLIEKEKFPAEYNKLDVQEDFELLFGDQMEQAKLKESLRSGGRAANQAVRKFLWKRILLPADSAKTMEKYSEKIAVLFGKQLKLRAELPDFVDHEHMCFYYLNETGRQAVCRLLNVLATVHPDITFAPLLAPLASLFLHYMTEQECFACLLSVIDASDKITQTDIHWVTTNCVFRRFAQKYTPSAYEFLLDGLYSHTNDLDECLSVLDQWLWWLFEHLPFDYVLNIVDCFLLEGQKVLYRFGLAVLDSFHRSAGRPLALKAGCVRDFCLKAAMPFERLLKQAFGYRNMSRKEIDSVFQAEEKLIKKMRLNKNENVERDMDFKKKIYSAIVAPLIKSNLIQDLDSGAKKPSGWSWSNPVKKLFGPSKKWYLSSASGSGHAIYHHQQLLQQHHHAQSQPSLPWFSVETIGSSVLSPEQISALWRWLPSRYQILELQLTYSTNIHGCRLMTLFDKIEFYQSSVIVLKTTTNSVFGAFCSRPWSERAGGRSGRAQFFGNGETFLFELVPAVRKYEWVGKASKLETASTQELFMYADADKLIVGGGGLEHAPGLLINSDLIYGRSAQCQTFNNQILGTETDFEIATLEVLTFKAADV